MGLRVEGAGWSMVQGTGFRVQGAGFRVQGAGCRVQGAGLRVQGSRHKHVNFSSKATSVNPTLAEPSSV